MSEKLDPKKDSDNFDDKSDLASSSDKVIFSLKQEFSLFNANIPNVIIEELNAIKRTCIASIKSSIICRLKIYFPNNYPNALPQFSFLNDANSTITNGKHLDESMKKEILKVLQVTANLQVQRNRNCLEKCLRQFVQTVEKLTSLNLNVNPVKPQPTVFDILTSHKYGSYLDASVPFPRTSGARFCSSEILVCFGRPPHLEQINVPTEYTPRSLSALSAYLTTHVRAYNSNQKDNIPSISSFYIDSSKKRRSFRAHQIQDEKKQKAPNLCGPVMVFSVTKLLPISRQLAELYLLPSKNDIIALCEMNAKLASTFGRRDLSQTWYLVRFSLDIYLKNRGLESQDLNVIWSRHPFGGRMIRSMIRHYVLNCNDIQTAAMIACVISFAKLHLVNLPSYRLTNENIRSDRTSYSNSNDEWTIIDSRVETEDKLSTTNINDDFNHEHIET
ncbi:hypothetical protein SSS_05913 [Sarcoptes scabiei]|nr:hypothetical protein SSS_05913 [Sarcoptes scabiei]